MNGTPRAGQCIEPLQFFERQHVAGRIRGARDAQRTDVGRHVESLEIDEVLEVTVIELVDPGGTREQHAWREADVGVTDVLRGQRQQDAAMSAVAALTGEQVEQEEERRLATAREPDVAGCHRPAEFIAQ